MIGEDKALGLYPDHKLPENMGFEHGTVLGLALLGKVTAQRNQGFTDKQ
jgi:hypothetical protein